MQEHTGLAYVFFRGVLEDPGGQIVMWEFGVCDTNTPSHVWPLARMSSNAYAKQNISGVENPEQSTQQRARVQCSPMLRKLLLLPRTALNDRRGSEIIIYTTFGLLVKACI